MSTNLELARDNMVENQIRTWEVLDPRVLAVLARLRREDFVPERYRDMAFVDVELPLGHGEIMLKPVIEGRILQALAIEPGQRVLEIGTGSGFMAACLAELGADLTSVELHADLAALARRNLDNAGLSRVRVEVGEAVKAYEPTTTFDCVVLTGAVFALPERIKSWVKPGGRLFAVSGESPAMQALLHTRMDDSHWQTESLFETDIPYLTHAAPPARFTL
ncbi:MAG: protein-L-isoaspartate O-methyltransferase [Dokdonella sp.]|uniref:protein-L-isoaspartate O-methyltransferase family protein n=1 Tax=Dokdonella sp. TaxID=2291710 RepID=UPI002C44673E|nr:protein-L-isoaspartate O-methyltransferase [Xanthomonadales bacterium]HQV73117.1 protein-L-isoaspartate O-methyltransferase [Dokdonella sp.]MBK7209968.1 protein-L-isoaspartate O-methyltransferase [Xanthomonadales bacterium]MBL0222626.1 protein-L-isoaspartate O-methyltransferase [Xanthomonadales bacterium]HQW76946.1 protein-L-isoaspartate O-methyltransferase [Dokdonella sp.]